MPLKYSQFTWGFEVRDQTAVSGQNNMLDFKEGSATYDGANAAVVPGGVYTADEFALAVRDAMRAKTQSENPNCTFNYLTREFELSGTGTFELLFDSGQNRLTSCAGLLGFAVGDGQGTDLDQTGANSYQSDAAAGDSPSTAGGWALAEPLVLSSPVTATGENSPAAFTQRSVIALQHVTDGGRVDTTFLTSVRSVQIAFRALTTLEQAKMESFLDWALTGKRLTWQPDKDSPNLMKLVLANPGLVSNQFEWLTRSETGYGTLTFYEQINP